MPTISLRGPCHFLEHGIGKKNLIGIVRDDDTVVQCFENGPHLLEPLRFFALQPSLLLPSCSNREDLSAELTASLTLLASPQSQLPQECGHEVYGFTCTLASPVINWIGLCCESLAFSCTIDKELVPVASALIMMPMIVPVPLAPVVFG